MVVGPTELGRWVDELWGVGKRSGGYDMIESFAKVGKNGRIVIRNSVCEILSLRCLFRYPCRYSNRQLDI